MLAARVLRLNQKIQEDREEIEANYTTLQKLADLLSSELGFPVGRETLRVVLDANGIKCDGRVKEPPARSRAYNSTLTTEQVELLRLIRAATSKGWTPTQIADAIGVGHLSVWRWESYRSVPYARDAKRLLPILRKMLVG